MNLLPIDIIKSKVIGAIREEMQDAYTEKWEEYEALNGDIYDLSSPKRSYVILRLNSFIGDGAHQFNSVPGMFTIEHILPQTIRRGSPWLQDWPEQKLVDKWLNKIANLVPLTRRINSVASNDGFDTKKVKYFSTSNGVTTYPLTTQILNEDSWTPEFRSPQSMVRKAP